MELYKNNNKECICNSVWSSFEHPGTLLYRVRELERVCEYTGANPLTSEKRILDLGCGDGNIGSIVFNKIDFGLDTVFNKIPGSGVYKSLVAANALDMPFKDSAFDVVFSNSVIEHIKDLDRVLGEVVRVLADGGLFIFTVPTDVFRQYLSLRPGGKIYAALRNKQLRHFNLLSEDGWVKKLEFLGLSVVYRASYLSLEEIFIWDKMCVLLRLAQIVPPLNRIIKHRFYAQAMEVLREKQPHPAQAGLLLVARK